MACSIRGVTAPPSSEKLLPATNISTGRLAPGVVCAGGGSGAVRRAPSYLTQRVNVTLPLQGPGSPVAAASSDAVGAGVAGTDGLDVLGSTSRPALTRSPDRRCDVSGRLETAVNV